MSDVLVYEQQKRLVIARLAKLSDPERFALLRAARGMYEGGERVDGMFHQKLAEAELVFRCSGHLRPHVYEHLTQSDEPALIG